MEALQEQILGNVYLSVSQTFLLILGSALFHITEDVLSVGTDFTVNEGAVHPIYIPVFSLRQIVACAH